MPPNRVVPHDRLTLPWSYEQSKWFTQTQSAIALRRGLDQQDVYRRRADINSPQCSPTTHMNLKRKLRSTQLLSSATTKHAGINQTRLPAILNLTSSVPRRASLRPQPCATRSALFSTTCQSREDQNSPWKSSDETLRQFTASGSGPGPRPKAAKFGEFFRSMQEKPKERENALTMRFVTGGAEHGQPPEGVKGQEVYEEGMKVRRMIGKSTPAFKYNYAPAVTAALQRRGIDAPDAHRPHDPPSLRPQPTPDNGQPKAFGNNGRAAERKIAKKKAREERQRRQFRSLSFRSLNAEQPNTEQPNIRKIMRDYEWSPGNSRSTKIESPKADSMTSSKIEEQSRERPIDSAQAQTGRKAMLQAQESKKQKTEMHERNTPNNPARATKVEPAGQETGTKSLQQRPQEPPKVFEFPAAVDKVTEAIQLLRAELAAFRKSQAALDTRNFSENALNVLSKLLPDAPRGDQSAKPLAQREPHEIVQRARGESQKVPETDASMHKESTTDDARTQSTGRTIPSTPSVAAALSQPAGREPKDTQSEDRWPQKKEPEEKTADKKLEAKVREKVVVKTGASTSKRHDGSELSADATAEDVLSRKLMDQIFSSAPQQAVESSIQEPKPDRQLPSIPLPKRKKSTAKGKDAERTRLYVKKGSDSTTSKVVLLLRNAPKSLTERDFRALLPRGKHLEEWSAARGFERVVAGRDEYSLERNGTYYIIFSSNQSAEDYQRLAAEALRHTGLHTPTDLLSPFPPVPGLLEDGVDLHAVMQSFALIPSNHALSLRMISPKNPQHSRVLAQILNGGDYFPIHNPLEDPQSGSKPRPLARVLLRVSGSSMTSTNIISGIKDDGNNRGRPWNFTSVASLQSWLENGYKRGLWRPLHHEEEEMAAEGITRMSRRFVISFADVDMAKRFAVGWNAKAITLPSTISETPLSFVTYTELL